MGERLKQLREDAGLEQGELSKAAGLKSRSHVWTIENGLVKTLSNDTAQALAGVLGVDWLWLLYGDTAVAAGPQAERVCKKGAGK